MNDYIEIPKKYLRFSTEVARKKLAARFRLPYLREMQDWEWEVADANRIEEFFNCYVSENLSDDEKFALMEILFQSVENYGHDLQNYKTWKRILESIENTWPLHCYSVWYWSDWENKDENEQWKVTPYLRKLFLKHKREIYDGCG